MCVWMTHMHWAHNYTKSSFFFSLSSWLIKLLKQELIAFACFWWWCRSFLKFVFMHLRKKSNCIGKQRLHPAIHKKAPAYWPALHWFGDGVVSRVGLGTVFDVGCLCINQHDPLARIATQLPQLLLQNMLSNCRSCFHCGFCGFVKS